MLLEYIVVPFVFAVTRAAHGVGYLPKIAKIALCAVALAYFSTVDRNHYVIGLVYFLLIWLGYGFGWGKYFSVLHGGDTSHEKEVIGIDWIYDRIVKYNPYLAGGVAMSLRWFIFFLPLFTVRYFLEGKLFITSALLLLVGLVYYSLRNSNGKYFNWYELVTGGLLGVALVV